MLYVPLQKSYTSNKYKIYTKLNISLKFEFESLNAISNQMSQTWLG